MNEYSYIPQPARHQGVHIRQRHFFLSADLGQANDYTAISIIERIVSGPGALGPDRNGIRYLHLRHIERPARGTPYPQIVERLKDLYHNEALRGVPKSVVIDLTGLGRPVYDLMRERGFRLSLSAVSITGGLEVTGHGSIFNVPKRNLITGLQVLLQNSELRIARGLKEAPALIEELTNFQTHISETGRDTYGGRSGVHDDLVLSVAIGCWLACRRSCRWGSDEAM